jgi:hypothetical protein
VNDEGLKISVTCSLEGAEIHKSLLLTGFVFHPLYFLIDFDILGAPFQVAAVSTVERSKGSEHELKAYVRINKDVTLLLKNSSPCVIRVIKSRKMRWGM